MSNSSLVTYTNITKNKTSPRNHTIDTITIHCIVGQWTAKQGCDYFATTDRECSANYVVGKDGSIGLSVDEKDRSWCSSSSANDNRAITIEVASDTTHPYAVTDAAYNALIDLCTDICQRNGIKQLLWKADKNLIGQPDKQNMTVHRWFANKACPGEYLYNRHGEIAAAVNKRLGAASPTTPATPAAPTKALYRVRKTWADSKNQKGAFAVLTNAQKCADENPGYSVFDANGVAIYPIAAASTDNSTDKIIWDFFAGKRLNAYAVAGIMGNLYAESALRPTNLQNSYEKKLGHTDDSYTKAVDNGTYTNFVKDSAGYGLAQWTYWSRKQALLEYAQKAKKSIGDLAMQLEFMWTELQGYTSVMKTLKTATSIQAASDAILTGYERPADQGSSVKAKRASYGKQYYDKYAAAGSATPAPAPSQTLTVGTEVNFTGTKHYTSAYKTATGKNCKAGKAKITAIAAGKAHPYHLVAVSGKGSTVYGWVDAADVSVAADQTIQKGDKVKVLKAQTYNGGTFKTYYDVYDVIQVNGDRVVIGIGKTVTAAVKASNLQKV